MEYRSREEASTPRRLGLIVLPPTKAPHPVTRKRPATAAAASTCAHHVTPGSRTAIQADSGRRRLPARQPVIRRRLPSGPAPRPATLQRASPTAPSRPSGPTRDADGDSEHRAPRADVPGHPPAQEPDCASEVEDRTGDTTVSSSAVPSSSSGWAITISSPTATRMMPATIGSVAVGKGVARKQGRGVRFGQRLLHALRYREK